MPSRLRAFLVAFAVLVLSAEAFAEDGSLFDYARFRSIGRFMPFMQEAPVPETAPKERGRGRNWFGARGGLWQLQLKGQIDIPAEALNTNSAIVNSDLSLENQLGIQDEQFALTGEVFLTTRFVDLMVSGWLTEWKGDTLLQNDFAFDMAVGLAVLWASGIQAFPDPASPAFIVKAKTPISTELEVETAELRLVLKPFTDFEYFSVGVLGAVRLMSVRARVKVDTTSFDVSGVRDINGNPINTITVSTPLDIEEEAIIPVPTVGLAARIFITKYVEVGGTAGYFEYATNSNGSLRARAFEAEGDITVNLGIENVSLSVNYYYLNITGEKDQLRANFVIQGPGAMLRLRF